MKELLKGKYLDLVEESGWQYVRRTEGRKVVAVTAITEDQEMLFVEQYRIPLKKSVIDLPAGLVESDEELIVAANRELVEETGYEANSLSHITTVPTSPGLTNEIVSIFYAEKVIKVGEGGGVKSEGEDIKVHAIPVRKLDAWLFNMTSDGNMIDMKVWIAVLASNYFEGD